MPVTRRAFGQLQDGRSVDSVVLSDPHSNFSVEVLEYGATIRAIHVADRQGRLRNTVLSYPTLSDYESGNLYLGATIGRCAGRTIANEDSPLRLSRNGSAIHLHGGTIGFSHSVWQIVDLGPANAPSVRMRHRSPAGEDGYPGELVVEAEFSLSDSLELRVVLEARSDADTPLNLTLHPYFNLDDDKAGTVDDHELRIDATAILQLGAGQIPTGEMISVDDTPFDFRRRRRLGSQLRNGHAQLQISGGYDHCYVLDGGEIAAELYSPASSLGLRIRTNQQGLQFYSGNQLDQGRPISFPARSGLCLEPQAFPNAINEPRFPDITLRAGEVYRHETSYVFYTQPA
jgi:aldose 1-epimerase